MFSLIDLPYAYGALESVISAGRGNSTMASTILDHLNSSLLAFL